MDLKKYVNIHSHHLKHLHSFEWRCLVVDFLDQNLTSNQKYPYLCVGIHPWRIKESVSNNVFEDLLKQCSAHNVVMIGESGVDQLYPDTLTWQLESLSHHLKISEQVSKPLVLHCVKAHSEIMKIAKENSPQMPWLIHDFKPHEMTLKQWLKLHPRIYFSTSFKNADANLGMFKKLGCKNRLFLETDDHLVGVEELYVSNTESFNFVQNLKDFFSGTKVKFIWEKEVFGEP